MILYRDTLPKTQIFINVYFIFHCFRNFFKLNFWLDLTRKYIWIHFHCVKYLHILFVKLFFSSILHFASDWPIETWKRWTVLKVNTKIPISRCIHCTIVKVFREYSKPLKAYLKEIYLSAPKRNIWLLSLLKIFYLISKND